MVTIEVKARSKSLRATSLDVSADAIVGDIVSDIARNNRTSIHRIRLTQQSDGKQVPLDTGASVKANGFANGGTWYIKDLGPQLSWRAVFVVEYLGPLLIHPITYWLALALGRQFSHTQTVALWLAVLHFAKRELETLFVHRFSNATMPAFNLFKNSGHYWISSGFLLAYFVYFGSSDGNVLFKVNEWSAPVNYALAVVWAYAELSNLSTHITLANLRPAGSKTYVIPQGYGFSLVSVPNYFFEILAWFVFAVLVGNWSAWFFLVVSAGQMYLWAVKKHKRYLKTFGDDYKKLNRKVIIPYVI